jgi:hypothetical protein
LREAVENPEKREENSLQAKQDIKNHFSPKVIAEQMKARLFS